MLTKRSSRTELLDSPELLDEGEIRGFLRAMARTNRWFGGTRMLCRVVQPLVEELHQRSPRRPIRIGEVGAGCGEFAAAMAKWARRRRIPLAIVSAELLPQAVEEARRRCSSYSEVAIVETDARTILRAAAQPIGRREAREGGTLPVATRPFDIVVASLVLHHSDEEEVTAWLALMASAARRAVVVSDLHRSFAAWLAVLIGAACMTRNKAFRHDAPLSILRAYTPAEWMRIARRAKLRGVQLERHSLGRILLLARGAARIIRIDDAANPPDRS